MSRALRVVVLSRHELVRAGLIWLLTNDSGGASIIEDLSYDAHAGSYDVAVYDLAGPNDVSRQTTWPASSRRASPSWP